MLRLPFHTDIPLGGTHPLHTGPESAALATTLARLSDLLRRTPCPSPRHLLTLVLLLTVGLVASKAPHLHHGSVTGLPDPELFIAGLTGDGIWQRFKLTISLDGHHSEETIADYRERWARWLAFLHDAGCKRRRCPRDETCTGIPWHKASERHLKRYLDQPIRSGPRAGRPLSVSSRAAYISCLKSVYAYAVRKRILSRDPLADVRPPRVGDGIPRSFSRTELQQLFALAASHHDPRVYLLCWLGYPHGLRCIEMARLGVEHLLLDEEPRMLIHGKGDRSRMVPVHQLFLPVLRAWIAGLPTHGPLVIGYTRWQTPTSSPLSPRTISDLLGRFIRSEVGLAGSAHWLRHTSATLMLDVNGENLFHVQHFLGHASPVTTQVYTRAHQWDVRRDMVKMPGPHDPFAPPADEPEPVAEVLRRVLTPELARRLLELDPELAGGLRPLLDLASRLEGGPTVERAV